MVEPLVDVHDAWVKAAFDIDPKAPASAASGPSSRRTALQQFGTGAVNLASDAVSELNIAGEAINQGTRGLVNKVLETGSRAIKGVRKRVGWGTPETAPPVGAVVLTSQAEEVLPAPRTRTRLGVGERVVLTVTGGPGKWQSSGGAALSAKIGMVVTMTAPQRPGAVNVTVYVGDTRRTMDFTVVAPSIVRMQVTAQYHEDNSLPNAGFDGGVYIGPDDVNFVNTENYEDDIRAKATGCWDEFNGEGHSPNADTNGCSNVVVAGLGTHSPGDDQIRSGWIPQPVPSNGDWSGTLTYNIPWHWKCGAGSGLIARVLHSCVTDAAGSTTLTKAGASFTAALSP